MEWREEGFVLAARPHGESSVILSVFTPSRGKHVGVLRGGTSRKMTPHIQLGTQLDLTWKARLEEHMGSFTIEPLRARAAAAMASKRRLAGLTAVCALLDFALPERFAFADFYNRTEQLLDLLDQDDVWPLAYLKWEIALLEVTGFGLDLSSCAVTHGANDLSYISPKSGRAVSAQGAGEWADRLLPLPPVMLGDGDADDENIALALGTTGYFLEQKLAPSLGSKPIPSARARFVDQLAR